MPIAQGPSVSSLTPRRVPEAYLRAEVSAYPLASEKAFHLAVVALDPELDECNETHTLWRACEAEFAPHTGWSLDRLIGARDRGWFGSKPSRNSRRIPLHEYLCKLARSHLVPRAGITTVSSDTDFSVGDAADRYRWLTLAVPEDLILAGLGVQPAPTRVDLEPPLLVRRLFDMGMAEVHHHIGSGMSFPLLWAAALAEMAGSRVSKGDFFSPGAPFSEGRKLMSWLLAAAVARFVLAEFLNWDRRGRRGGERMRTLSDFLQRLNDVRGGALVTARARETLSGSMTALICGKAESLPGFDDLHDLYSDMHPRAAALEWDPLTSITDAFKRCDPIAARFDLEGENAGERWFMCHGLAYLRAGEFYPAVQDSSWESPDPLFELLFWQVIRVRCQYYRAIVERPLTGGLQWFLRFYDRIGKLRSPLKPILPQVSYEIAGGSERIRALEVRHTALDTAVEVGTELLEYLTSWKRVLREKSHSGFEPELGVIYNFVKIRAPEKAWNEGRPAAYWKGTYAEPNPTATSTRVEQGRFAGYFAEQCRKANALSELIEEVPSVLWLVRGLDVASDEIAVPTWVLVPLFRHIVEVSARVFSRRSEDAGPPLKITAHVGEDFRHLLEGLRRVYEQVHYVFAGAAGRLGHAIALGTDPRSWADSVGSVLMPAEERLWDLVWEWRLYTRHKIRTEYAAQAPSGRVEELRSKVRDLVGAIYQRELYRIEELADAHHLLHGLLLPPFTIAADVSGRETAFAESARAIENNRFSSCSQTIGKILTDYLTDENVFLRGQTLIDVPVQPEVDAILAVQDALRRGIGRTGIVVEVNPSSNLLIGDMLELRNHPILRLFPPMPDADAPPPVPIAVGSDDPVTFSTRLLNEYSLLHQTACAAGYPERVVHAWLEAIRSTGMDARFTTIWHPDGVEKADALIERLTRYLQLPSAAEGRPVQLCARLAEHGGRPDGR